MCVSHVICTIYEHVPPNSPGNLRSSLTASQHPACCRYPRSVIATEKSVHIDSSGCLHEVWHGSTALIHSPEHTAQLHHSVFGDIAANADGNTSCNTDDNANRQRTGFRRTSVGRHPPVYNHQQVEKHQQAGYGQSPEPACWRMAMNTAEDTPFGSADASPP